MKKIIFPLVALVCLLPGCAVVDAYLMTKYDPNEYKIVTDIRLVSEKAAVQCEDANASKVNANQLADKTRLFELYSQEIPRNKDNYAASHALNEIAQGLAKKYNDGEKVSPLFCKLKFEGIRNSADVIRHVLANRPR